MVEQEEDRVNVKEKSIVRAYLCFVFGGIFGIHHLYLDRDYQAIFTSLSLGGCYGLGLIADFFILPGYVRQYNNRGYWIELEKLNRKHFPVPRTDFVTVILQMFVGAFFRALVHQAIPYNGYEALRLILIPIACGFGVWIVGKVYHLDSSYTRTVIACGIPYLILVHVLGIPTKSAPLDTSLGAVYGFWKSSALTYSPDKGRVRRGRKRLVAAGFILLLSLQGAYYFNNATINVEGVPVKLRDLLTDFFNSTAWVEFKVALRQFWDEVYVIGIMPALNRLVNFSTDGLSEEGAYEVLGVPSNITSSELRKKFRQISLKLHPDKVPPQDRERATVKFMEYKSAYEVILRMRTYRKKIESAKILKEFADRFKRFEEKHQPKSEL